MQPIEIYGKSKLAGENLILEEYKDVSSIIIRCPTIMTAGRLGLLTILFDFVREGRRLISSEMATTATRLLPLRTSRMPA